MKRLVCIILCIIMMLGVSGCMSNEQQHAGSQGGENQNSAQMEQEILNYLNGKYGEHFEMVQLTHEFDGDNGAYYRAVIRSDKRPEKGVLYCYEEGSGQGTRTELAGKTWLVEDDYANVILQNEYAAALQAQLGGDVLVKCQIEIPNHMLTDAEFAAGVQACLENAQLYPQLYVYIIAGSADSAVNETAQEYLDRYNVYRQYLYVGYQDQPDLADWEALYYEHYTSFERYLVDESAAARVEFSAFTLDKGLTSSSVVKE